MEETKFTGWGLCEIMGRQRIAGRFSERSIAGTSLLQVDIPIGEGTEDFRTQFVGGGSIHSLHPTDEKTARLLAKRLDAKPVYAYDVEQQLRIESRKPGDIPAYKEVVSVNGEDDDDRDDSDLYDNDD